MEWMKEEELTWVWVDVQLSLGARAGPASWSGRSDSSGVGHVASQILVQSLFDNAEC